MPPKKRARTAAAAAEPAVVVCYGDSNTWGYNPHGSSRFAWSDRWTTHLERVLGPGHRVVAAGLNARTTVFEDPVGPAHAEYSCNGRSSLMTTLHSVKPVACVVMALGVNDLKTHFGASPSTIAAGAGVLVRDVLRSTSRTSTPAPAAIVLGEAPKCVLRSLTPSAITTHATGLTLCSVVMSEERPLQLYSACAGPTGSSNTVVLALSPAATTRCPGPRTRSRCVVQRSDQAKRDDPCGL